jgi:hypothetical protein
MMESNVMVFSDSSECSYFLVLLKVVSPHLLPRFAEICIARGARILEIAGLFFGKFFVPQHWFFRSH